MHWPREDDPPGHRQMLRFTDRSAFIEGLGFTGKVALCIMLGRAPANCGQQTSSCLCYLFSGFYCVTAHYVAFSLFAPHLMLRISPILNFLNACPALLKGVGKTDLNEWITLAEHCQAFIPLIQSQYGGIPVPRQPSPISWYVTGSPVSWLC
jgi:hypothetical protein